MATSIERIGLSNDVRRALRRSRIYSAEKLAEYSDEELLALRSVSKPQVREIAFRLSSLGLPRPLAPTRRRRRS